MRLHHTPCPAWLAALRWPLLLLGALLTALLPRTALAACGPTDLGACMANAQYDLWYTVASFAWWLDSALLVLAYQLGALRQWAVETVFASAYLGLTELVNPLIVPAALIAATLAVLAFWLTPLLGAVRLVKLRQVLVWAVLAPLLLTAGGQFLVQLDTARTDVSTAISQSVAMVAGRSTPLFGARGSDMPAPQRALPADPCGTGTLSAPVNGIVMDLAYAFAYAKPGDAFCAALVGPSRDIPDAFYLAPPAGPGFAFDGTVGDLEEPQRSGFVQGIQRGATRLWMGVLPCLLAALDSFIQLLFSLALVVLWAVLPFALLVAFFIGNEAVTLLARRALAVLQISWTSTFLLTLVAVALQGAGSLSNAVAFVGFVLGASVLYGFLLANAALTLIDSLRTVHDALTLVTGVNVGRTMGTVTDVAAGGAASALTFAGGAAGAALLIGAASVPRSAPTGGMGGVGDTTFNETTLNQTLIVMQVGDVGRAMGYATPPKDVTPQPPAMTANAPTIAP